MSNLNWNFSEFNEWVREGCCPEKAQTVGTLYISGYDTYDAACLNDMDVLKLFTKLHTLTFKYMYRTVSVLNAIDVISHMPWLVSLDISENDLNALPHSIGQLVNLEELNIGYNEVTALPLAIWDLTQLRSFDARYNMIKNLPPDVGALRELRTLCVSNNNIKALPDEICELRQLEVLDIAGNHLHALPANFGDKMHSLRELYMSGNNFDAIPDMIYRMCKLEKFIMRGVGSERFLDEVE
jgi:Leucine-rich repeat (LRR) protein